MTDKLRKYMIPNIPYLFLFWAFTQLGEAYRIAPEGGAEKLINMLQTVGPAFGTIVPGHGFDLLVGLCGAVLIRFIVWRKAQKAKKFRKDAEYGSARWGTAEDIKPFVDPVFENNKEASQLQTDRRGR